MKINNGSAYKASLIWEWIPKTAAFSKSDGKSSRKATAKNSRSWWVFLVMFVIGLTPSAPAESFNTGCYYQFMKAKPQVHQISKNTRLNRNARKSENIYTPVPECSYSHTFGAVTDPFFKWDSRNRAEDLVGISYSIPASITHSLLPHWRVLALCRGFSIQFFSPSLRGSQCWRSWPPVSRAPGGVSAISWLALPAAELRAGTRQW